MKNFLILAVAVLGMAMSAPAQNRSINFIEGKTFEEIKELAKQENKLIFLDIYASWCGPCKLMDKKVYANDTVADFYNSHFINVKIDLSKEEGKKLGRKYQAYFLPTLVLISSDEVVENMDYGFKSCGEFMQLGLDVLDPKKKFSALEARSDDPIKFDSLLCILSFGVAGMPIKKDSAECTVYYFGDSGQKDGKNELLPESSKALEDVYYLMEKDPAMDVCIVGYINDARHLYRKGYLVRAADRWTKTVSDYLTSRGISEKRIFLSTEIRYEDIQTSKSKNKKPKAEKLAENRKYMGVEVRRIIQK